MKQRRKITLKYLFAGTLTAILIFTLTWKTEARYVRKIHFYNTLTADTIKPLIKKDSSIAASSLADTSVKALQDTSSPKEKVDTFNLKLSKDSLDGPVNYEAEDSAVVLIKDQKILLYGQTKTTYKDITLTAPKVELDQQTNILTAVNSKDSTGDVVERAHFEQGDNKFQSDTIRYDFKTQRGLTKNTFTKQGDLYFQGSRIKSISKNVFFAGNGVITTCNYDDPHFGFHYSKIKVINNKVAISGPIHPEFEHVPIPIYLPFGYFPLSQGRHSGFIAPQFTSNEQYGIGLEGLGYYKVLNDNFDVTVRTDIYSYGSWRLNLVPTYRKRYHYSGQLGFTLQTTKLNFKGDPDFSKTKTFQLNWSHRMDSKARPGVSFSGNVNVSSTKFNQQVLNNPNLVFNNTQSSSISYSKQWQGKPFNLTINANHNQNNRLHYITLNLPDVGFTVNTIYPFQKKEAVGKGKWYEKLGIGYNGTFTNSVSFYDTLKYGQNNIKPFLKYLLDTAVWTSHHSIPITLSLPPILGGAIVISPGVSYNQDWIQKTTNYEWNAALKKVDTVLNKGFFIDQKASFSLGISTALYGKYIFNHSKKNVILRNVMRPSLSLSYTPDLNSKFIKQVQVDTLGRKLNYNAMGGSYYYVTPTRSFAGLSFQLDNNLEMKYRSKKDTGDQRTKIKLIDGYGFSFSYNLLADSFALSQSIPFYVRSTLFQKINITAGANLNPYKQDKYGFTTKQYAWQGGKFSLGKITSGNISISTSFQSKPKDEAKEKARQKEINDRLNDPTAQADQNRLMDYMRQNPSEFVNFNIPWSLSLGLSVYFTETVKPDYSGFEKQFTSSANFSGTFNLTPKWNFSTSGMFNIKEKKIQPLQLSVSRDMHCWQMSISVVPTAPYRSFGFTISPKASILQDLKINRNRTFSGY